MSKVMAERPKILVSTRGMSREDWLEARRQVIGGSDAGAILGLNPYKTAFDVWRSKVEPPEEDTAGEAAHWGNLLEPVIADEFRRQTGFRVHRLEAILVHPKWQFMGANVDRLIRCDEGTGVLEVKTAGAFRAKEWESGNVPPEYYAQVQHYLMVTGLPFAYVAVLIGGQRFVHLKIERDEDLIESLIACEVNFWTAVELGEPPALDGSRAATEYLKSRFPRARAEAVSLPSEAEALAAEFLEADAEAKIAAKRADAASNQLKALLGEAERATVGGYEVGWKNVTQERLDSKALKEAHPEIIEEFTRETTYRKFSVKAVGDDAE